MPVKTTKYITTIIKIQHWACNVPVHRHKLETTAQHCIDHELVLNRGNPIDISHRNMQIYKKYNSGGVTQRSLAKQYNVTPSRISSIIQRINRAKDNIVQADETYKTRLAVAEFLRAQRIIRHTIDLLNTHNGDFNELAFSRF